MRFNRIFYYIWLMLASTTQVLAEGSDVRSQGDLTQIPIEQSTTMDAQSTSKISSQIRVASFAVSFLIADDLRFK
ncbi:MAG: hypothetical protein Q7T58_06240 [Methylotenera sp.]|nr:hypothetical protein [Methylotenera sp.]